MQLTSVPELISLLLATELEWFLSPWMDPGTLSSHDFLEEMEEQGEAKAVFTADTTSSILLPSRSSVTTIPQSTKAPTLKNQNREHTNEVRNIIQR